jgi:hypothetical protein
MRYTEQNAGERLGSAGQPFWTLPAFRQEVHTRTRLGAPATMARIRWMLGFQRRFVRRCEWLTRMPTRGRLPHTSHTADMTTSLAKNGNGKG